LFVDHEKHKEHEKLALSFFIAWCIPRFHHQNSLVDDSFLLLLVTSNITLSIVEQ